MNDDLDLIGAHTEQPVRLDDFEALVHQSGGIDRDLAPHAPCRMHQRILRRDARQLGRRTSAERSSRRGQDEPSDLRPGAPVQALVDRVVLAVDRQNGDATAAGGLGDDAASHHEHFLVRKRDGLAVLDGRDHRFEPLGPRGGAQHEVDVGMRGDRDEAVTAGTAERHVADPGLFEAIERGAGRHRRNRWPIAGDLCREQIGVFSRRQPDDLQAIGVRVDDGQRVLADGPGRAEDGDALHYFTSTAEHAELFL